MIAKSELMNCAPGICVKCGKFTDHDRDTGGNCNACHNQNYLEYRKRLKEHNEKQKEQGILYWRERGIAPGDRVVITAISWTGTGAEEVHGIAKVGSNGAYVASAYQPGKLAPGGWIKA